MQWLLEGPAIEPLLQRVREEHGPDVRIVRAERVRVGGFIGFFAREQFEVTIEVDESASSRQAGADGPAGSAVQGPGRSDSARQVAPAHGGARGSVGAAAGQGHAPRELTGVRSDPSLSIGNLNTIGGIDALLAAAEQAERSPGFAGGEGGLSQASFGSIFSHVQRGDLVEQGPTVLPETPLMRAASPGSLRSLPADGGPRGTRIVGPGYSPSGQAAPPPFVPPLPTAPAMPAAGGPRDAAPAAEPGVTHPTSWDPDWDPDWEPPWEPSHTEPAAFTAWAPAGAGAPPVEAEPAGEPVDAASTDAVTDDAASTDAMTDDAVPDDAVPDDAVPDDAVPDDATAKDTGAEAEPAGEIGEAAAVDAAPVEAVPADAAPAEVTPEPEQVEEPTPAPAPVAVRSFAPIPTGPVASPPMLTGPVESPPVASSEAQTIVLPATWPTTAADPSGAVGASASVPTIVIPAVEPAAITEPTPVTEPNAITEPTAAATATAQTAAVAVPETSALAVAQDVLGLLPTQRSTDVEPLEQPSPSADPMAAPAPRTRREARRLRAERVLDEGEHLAERLAALGVPASWLATLPTVRGEALGHVASCILATPTQARRRSTVAVAPVVVVLADLDGALPVARQLAVGLGLDSDDVLIMNRKLPGLVRDRCLPSRADVMEEVDRARARQRALVIVLPAPVGAPVASSAALADTLTVLDADEVWAVVDATRRLEDTNTWLATLTGGRGVDAVALTNTDVTAAPAAALGLAAPVVLLGEQPATPSVWVAMLAARLAAQDLT